MTLLDEFRTAAFRAAAKKIEDEITSLKEQAVRLIDEAVHVHPHRVGLVQGLKKAMQILRDAEKEIMGETK